MVLFTWFKFSICGGLILFTGYHFSKYGDIICEKTSISRGLMGFIFLSFATTLPEVVTSASSIVVVNSPDLAVGNAFGSVIINLMYIALLDFLQGKGPLLYNVSMSNILYGGLGIVALAITGFSIFLRSEFLAPLGIFNFGFESLILIILYFIGVRIIFRYEKNSYLTEKVKSPKDKKYENISLEKAIIGFCLCFGGIFFLGIWLSTLGDEIVKVMNWSEAIVGTFFLALATSLPELIVSLSSLKFAIDMAIGNILGANFLDIMIIPICDLFFRRGELLSFVSIKNILTLMLGIILTSIVIIGLICRSRKSFLRLGWDAIGMIFAFIIGGYFIIFFAK
ncbi:sodium:calcium antiporter [Candidatus Aerophobetes bacterium]|nr:sodium:calcium antiporter [Candidatus Aerophobetes bacterium]